MKLTIFHNATILTINKNRDILEKHSLVVENDHIKEILPAQDALKKYKDANTIDCLGKLLMPGLIDVHAHGGISLFRNVIKDTSQWMTSLTNTLNHFVRQF